MNKLQNLLINLFFIANYITLVSGFLTVFQRMFKLNGTKGNMEVRTKCCLFVSTKVNKKL